MPPPAAIGFMKPMFTTRQHELRIRFVEVRIFWHRVPPPSHHRIRGVDAYKTTTRVKDTISRSSYVSAAGAPPILLYVGTMKSMFAKRQHELRIRSLEVRDLYKIVSFGIRHPRPSIGLMKPMFTKRQHELRIRSLANRILWHRVSPPPP